jgi:hypothetical protein
MSRTEDRLTDALDAMGRTVADENLRPLPGMAAGSAAAGHGGWRRWLAPAAAAAAVVVIASLAVTPILGQGTGRGTGSGAGGSATTSQSGLVYGVSRCAPRVMAATSGGPAADYTRADREVASGTVAGRPWSVWVKRGLSQPTALEDGGLVLAGRWYGMCAGLPNVLETELVDTGGPGVAYGYLAYPGPVKVSMTPAHAMGALHVVRLAGVSAFIAPLSESACAYPSVTVHGSARTGSAMHHLEFGTCEAGHDVAITASDGSWSESGAQSGVLLRGCRPNATLLSSGGPAAPHIARDVKVAAGTIGGQAWGLWSQKGSHGVDGIKNGGLVLSGRWYGLCPLALNPASFELIDAGSAGVVYGFVASPGDYAIGLTGRTARQRVPKPAVYRVQGGTFFIGLLPRSACDYLSMTLDAIRSGQTDSQTLDFRGCLSGHLVEVRSGSGSW